LDNYQELCVSVYCSLECLVVFGESIEGLYWMFMESSRENFHKFNVTVNYTSYSWNDSIQSTCSMHTINEKVSVTWVFGPLIFEL